MTEPTTPTSGARVRIEASPSRLLGVLAAAARESWNDEPEIGDRMRETVADIRRQMDAQRGQAAELTRQGEGARTITLPHDWWTGILALIDDHGTTDSGWYQEIRRQLAQQEA